MKNPIFSKFSIFMISIVFVAIATYAIIVLGSLYRNK